MANTENTNQDDGLQTVESAFGKAEQYIEKNRNTLGIIIIAVVAVVVAVLVYNKFIKIPKENKAAAEMYQAENNFERDSFKLALNGDANYPGFLGIMKDYSGTKAANLAHYYAGVCYLNLGEYDNAIAQLKDFSTDDISLLPISTGLIGDAYMEKNDVEKAIAQYKKAAKEGQQNNFVAPIYLMKLGRAYEKQQKWQQAIDTYNEIKKNYPNSNEGRSIEKYITAANLKLAK